MKVGVWRESYPEERRVALTPAVIPRLTALGLEGLIQAGAGLGSGFLDSAYLEAGAQVVAGQDEVVSPAEILLRVRGPGPDLVSGASEIDMMRPGQVLLGLLDPLGNPGTVAELAAQGVTALALELLPRISRAQPMDALTSMSTISGYKAVLLAANALPKLFPMMMTAAGTVTPAHVFVVGAGVAGLQAIATARRLGAVVEAYDVRPSASQEVESLGAKFVTLPLPAEGTEDAGGYARAMDEDFYRRQREMMLNVVATSDVVITTASVPGRKAPLLITADMVRAMPSGAVIVDLAAETGGNCELTLPGQTVEVGGVTVIGPINLPATVPYHASQMYARNLAAFLEALVKDGQLNLDLEDPIIRDTMVTHQGEVTNQQVKDLLSTSNTP